MSKENKKDISNEDLLKNTMNGFLEGKPFDRFSNKFGEEELEYSTNTDDMNKNNQFTNSSDLALDIVIAMKNELYKKDKENKELLNADFQHYQMLHAKKGSEGQYQFFLEKDKEDKNALKEQKASKFKEDDFKVGDVVFYKGGIKGKQWGGEAVVMEEEGQKVIVTMTKEGFKKIDLEEWLSQQKDQTIARGRFNFNKYKEDAIAKREEKDFNDEIEEDIVEVKKKDKMTVKAAEGSSLKEDKEEENKKSSKKESKKSEEVENKKTQSLKSKSTKEEKIGDFKKEDVLKTENKNGVTVVHLKNGDVEVIGGPIKSKAVYQGKVVSDDFIAKLEEKQNVKEVKHEIKKEAKLSIKSAEGVERKEDKEVSIQSKVEDIMNRVSNKMEEKVNTINENKDELIQVVKQSFGINNH